MKPNNPLISIDSIVASQGYFRIPIGSGCYSFDLMKHQAAKSRPFQITINTWHADK